MNWKEDQQRSKFPKCVCTNIDTFEFRCDYHDNVTIAEDSSNERNLFNVSIYKQIYVMIDFKSIFVHIFLSWNLSPLSIVVNCTFRSKARKMCMPSISKLGHIYNLGFNVNWHQFRFPTLAKVIAHESNGF